MDVVVTKPGDAPATISTGAATTVVVDTDVPTMAVTVPPTQSFQVALSVVQKPVQVTMPIPVQVIQANVGLVGPVGPEGPEGPTGQQGVPGPPGASNAAYSGEWTWTTSTGAPSNGAVGANTTDWSVATQLNLNDKKNDQVDTSAWLNRIKAGDQLRVQLKTDSARYMRYDVVGPGIDNITYWSYPVSLVQGSGNTPGNNNVCLVSWLLQGEASVDPAIFSYRHIQVSAATIWTINHGLGFRPNVSVVDSAGTQVFPGSLTYVTPTQIQLTFSAALGGEAYLS